MIEKVVTNVFDTNNGKCADVFAYVKSEKDGYVTVGCSRGAGEEVFTMCYAWIDPEDPGDAPSRTFKDKEDAVKSEYGDVFEKVFDIASKALAG